jgi:uncharacterized protein GlcG (DUF336 family)
MRTQGRKLTLGLIGFASLVASVSLFEFQPVSAKADSGPRLTPQDVRAIEDQGVASANVTPSGLRAVGGVGKNTRMIVVVVDRSGKLLGVEVMGDAWVGSYDIAIAKARTAAFFSSDQNALTSRVIGALSQPGQPLWGIGNSNQIGVSGNQEFRNGIITFPGGVPLYKNGKLVGGVGVSGDGVDQDEAVAFAASAGYGAPANIAKLGIP